MNLNPNTKAAYQLLHDGILAFARAEQQGIRIDMEYAERKKQHLTRKIDRLVTKFEQTKFYRHWEDHSKSKPNINSPVQLGHFLYNVKKLKPIKLTPSGKGSTDEDSLTQLNIPELNDMLKIRKLKQLRDTFLEGFIREQVNGYIHPFFNLHLVITYRSSSDHPNFQNNPIRDEEAMQTVRKAIYPRPAHQLLEVDYSGLEVRIGACYHKDERMLKYIKNPASDMHADMAKQIFMMDKFSKGAPEQQILRQAAKNGFIFPQFYGDYYGNCAVNICNWIKLPQNRWKNGQGISIEDPSSIKNGLDGIYIKMSDHLISKGIKSFNQFTDHIKEIEYDFWTNRFPDYQIWKDQQWENYQKCGYIDMLTGFRCSGVMNYKNVTNYLIQGAAFHCLLWSFISLDKIMRKEKWDSKLIGQIHDSIIFDCSPKELSHILKTVYKVTCVDLPKAWPWIIVPLNIEAEICSVDGSWAEKSKLELK